MRKSVKENYIYNLAYQMLVLVTPLITVPYVSRVLGADGIGTISYVESVAAYLEVFMKKILLTLFLFYLLI